MRWILLLIFFFNFVPLGLFAQNELLFSHLGVEDGFTIDKANTIIQDRKGFVWVGTWNGLNRFDGYDCITYQPNFHDSTSISSREIIELMEDKKGNLWIGTSNGLDCMNLETGELKSYGFNNRILSLCEDNDGIIWIGTWNGGLFRLVPSTGEISHYLANEVVSDIYEDSRNILWVATYYGLVKFDTENGSYDRHLPKNSQNSISHSVVTQITESKDGKLWIGTWGGGLNKVDVAGNGDKLHFTHYKFDNNENSLSSNVIYRLCYDQYDNLWIGTWNEGLNLLKYEQQQLSPEKARFLSYKEDVAKPTSLSGNGISSVYVDRSGILWVGASKIDRTSIVENGIKRYALPKNEDNPFTKVNIRAFAEYNHQLWVGTDHNLIQYEEKNDDYILQRQYEKQSYKYDSTQYTAYSIIDMIADSLGLWIGTEDAGLIYYNFTSDLQLDLKTQQFFNQQTEPSLPGNKVVELVYSKKYPGVIWVGTMQNGFAKLEKKAGKITIEKFSVGNSDNNIRSIYEDSEGKVWIGTQNGLNCFDPEEERFKTYFYSSSNTNSINDNVINSIIEDAYGNLWVGTNSGLNKKIKVINDEGKTEVKFKGYPTTNYLSNEYILNLLEDESGNLWVRLYRGFIKLNIEIEKVVGEYFSKDYENLRLERNTALKFDDSEFILGDQSGFVTFYPDSMLKKSQPPKVVITDLLIFNKSIEKQEETEEKYELTSTIPFADHVKLSYKDKMLTFVFSAMDYKNPDKNIYYYQLEGFDDQWNVIGSRNSATYTNIPQGKYIFKVKATNSDGDWSESITTLGVSISPPWWKTIWAYLFYCLIVVGILYFFRKYSFIKAQVKSNLQFEKMKTEEMRRLNELKSFFFTDITHELKTPLTLILGPARELLDDKTLGLYAKKQAGLIKNSAYKLLRLVNQLMEFRKIEKGILDELYVQRCDLSKLLREVYGFFKTMADSRNINFSISFDQEPVIAFVDTEKLEKVIFNLISNAFKYSPDQGMISVYSAIKTDKSGKQTVTIEVEDSGLGIADEYKEKVFERFFQINQIRTQSTGGIGLFMAKVLVEQHGGIIKLDSEVGKGSCFTIHLPVDSSLMQVNSLAEINSTQASDILSGESLFEHESESKGIDNLPVSDYKPCILVVEDDADLNDFLVSGLSDEFKVINAFNGKEGLKKTKNQNPDIILTDIMMPEMDGFEFCKITRKDINISHIPFVFLTAKTMQEDEIRGLKLGAVDYIYKPFNLVSLKLKIHNILLSQKQIQERIRTEQILRPESIELSSLDEVFLQDAIESVNKNLDDSNFDVEAFSSDLGVSPNQVYRKIKALTGQTAKEFIRNQRLKIAADLLLQRKRYISEIIYMVGFTSPSYFSRCFKEFYGCSPKEYIEQNE
ncbi:MAG: response regulator [Labilibaculum sp.]|nr:response regulator [Labilibaculum sp.]